MEKTTFDTSGQSVQKSPEGLFLQDGIAGLRSLPRHSVDMLLTDPPYGTTRNFWDVPLPLPELWEAVKWADNQIIGVQSQYFTPGQIKIGRTNMYFQGYFRGWCIH